MVKEITINTGKMKKNISSGINFLKQKKIINIIFITLFILLLISSTSIRLQNLPLLQDQTTEEYIPLALDPFYFLRIAETIESNNGVLPSFDNMRYPSAQVGFSNEILPQAVVLIHTLWKVVDSNVSLQFVNVVSPVIFFILGLIAFFFLILYLTNSKITAFLASLFLAVLPTYLYRTMAGFSDHDSIGMLAFFLVLLGYSLTLKYLDKKKDKKNIIKPILFGLGVGFLSAFAVASWGGVANFVFMIIPISFLIFWLVKVQNEEKIKEKPLLSYLSFYFFWFISSILFGLNYGFSSSFMMGKVFLNSSSLINGIVLLFILSDFIMIKYKSKINFISQEKLKKFRILFSVIVAIILGTIIMTLLGKNIISFISEIFGRLLNPFGGGRTSLTVAENKQPYLNDWIGQTGKTFFWLFFGGLVALGLNVSNALRKNKEKITLFLLWIFLISGILFSRISPSHLFNGENFVSGLFYFVSLVAFFGYLIYVYFKEKIKIKPELIILFSWMIFILISAKGAVRLFFAITPFMCFAVAYFLINIFNYFKKSKDDFLKMALGIFLIIIIILTIININGFVQASSSQAKYTGPSASIQWQNAMEWVRENTPEGSIFVHWWDYGYWVEYLGERPSLTDGGHAIGFWDHLIGRYVLTTPDPNTALSFMKTHNVSYLLVDPTELGKYPAYSKIGSNDLGEDRFGQIPVITLNQQQTYENEDGIVKVYDGGFANDEDLIYNYQGNEILLPANQAFIAAITFQETTDSSGENQIDQPNVVFIYNNQQISVPLRYAYFENSLIDFGGGIEAGIRIIPKVDQISEGINVDQEGALIYLSPKTFKGLIGQLYIFNNALENYDSLTLVKSEQDPIVANLNSVGGNLGDFIYFGGFRGSINIWEVSYPLNIVEREEFLRTSGEYAEFDNLIFTSQ